MCARRWLNDRTPTTPQTQRPSFPLYHPTEPSYPIEKAPYDVDYVSLPSEKTISKSLKFKITEEVTKGLPEFTEEELREFYRAVVESGVQDEGSSSDVKVDAIEAPRRSRGLMAIRERLEENYSDTTAVATSEGDYGVILRYLGGTSVSSVSSKGKEPMRGPIVPLGILTSSEWQVLFNEAIARRTVDDVHALLNLMQVRHLI
jgi:hypothetical protein